MKIARKDLTAVEALECVIEEHNGPLTEGQLIEMIQENLLP